MSTELIAKALRRAYELGKTYWQQADSESYKQNRLSEGTHQKFEALIEETILAPQAPAAQAPQAAEPVADLLDDLERYCQDSDDSMHGTIAIDFVRQFVKDIRASLAPPAPAAQPVTEAPTLSSLRGIASGASGDRSSEDVVESSRSQWAAPQAPAAQPLTDDEIDDAQDAAYRALSAMGFSGGMGGYQWDHASARAIERAVWAKLGIAPPAQGEPKP